MHSETFPSRLIKSYKQQPLDVLESLIHLVPKERQIYDIFVKVAPRARLGAGKHPPGVRSMGSSDEARANPAGPNQQVGDSFGPIGSGHGRVGRFDML